MIVDSWRLQRRWRRLQRPLAVALIGSGVLLLFAERRAPVTTDPTVVAVHDMPVGHQVGPSDVEVVAWPRTNRPPASATTTEQLIGRRTTAAVTAGEPLTPMRVLGPEVLAGTGTGLVAVPIPEDPLSAAGLIRPGDEVDVVGQSQTGPRTLVRAATVLTVAEGAGPIVAVPADAAAQVVQASATDSVAVVLLGR